MCRSYEMDGYDKQQQSFSLFDKTFKTSVLFDRSA